MSDKFDVLECPVCKKPPKIIQPEPDAPYTWKVCCPCVPMLSGLADSKLEAVAEWNSNVDNNYDANDTMLEATDGARQALRREIQEYIKRMDEEGRKGHK